MDTKELNVNRLCEKWENDDMVMPNWMKTNSLLWSYWMRFMVTPNEGLKDYNLPSSRCNHKDGTHFSHNLPRDEGESLCKSLYSNEVVKLTVQIADPYVMVIEKDVSATFTDKLGIVGRIISLFL